MSPLPVVDDLSDGEQEPPAPFQEWTAFLTSYARGEWQSDGILDMPRYLQDPDCGKLEGGSDESEDDWASHRTDPTSNVYSSPVITRKIASRIHRYCAEKDFLPPPRSPQESLREKIILEYDLNGPVQAGNIQSAVDLTAAFFSGCVVTFTLFSNAIQNFVAVAGPQHFLSEFGLHRGMWVAPETSLCGHSILLDRKIMFIANLDDDWRFRSNPYGMAGVKSYIGSPVSLELDPLNNTPRSDGNPEQVSIGALNILYLHTPLLEMAAQQEMVVRNVTKMLETQLRATWEGHTRTREAKTRRAITELIDEAFVGDQAAMSDSAFEADRFKKGVILAGDMTSVYGDLAQSALEKTVILCEEVEGIIMLDIRSLRYRANNTSKSEYAIDPSSSHPVHTIAAAPRQGFTWDSPPTASDLTRYLNESHSSFTFSRLSSSALQDSLPAGIRSHLVMPFFTLEQPSFVIIAISREEKISQASVNITRSMGSILLAKAVQSRVMEADTAKTAFLSSISHELRTPMHSILSGLTLARSAIKDQDWDNLRSLLSVVENSGQALHRILDDVLDFDPGFKKKTSILREVRVDLLKLAKEAIRMCLTRSDDLELRSIITIEHEERDWIASIDEARFNRILINGITNSMKFCKKGSITVSLSTSDNSTTLIARITDTGIGIEEKVLPRLLEPFTKQDMHSPGAGLGLYITKNLVNSMGGTFSLRSSIGKGTTFEAILPIKFVNNDADLRANAALSRMSCEKAVVPRLSIDVAAQKVEASSKTETGSTRRPESQSLTTPNSDVLKVMVVDDNRICRMLLTKSIQRGKTLVDCVQASDGKEAVEIFRTFHPHLVITDVSMPVMDGITAAQQMRSISEELRLVPCKIYALTGLGSSDPRLQSIGLEGSAALDGWLVKGQDDLKAIQVIIGEVHQETQARNVEQLKEKVDGVHIDTTPPADSLLLS
ncbi:uncharacterized protein I303_104073 [Kwoniella dejecticola CBS 10117]|uniref:histidine kinase n=1 Tax=Kwoniella dejecticola CBS 10117 TaxID=1296121 RepID=A0A1A6A8J0_9TREE|nr:uncharacterized protein I303_04092 [Kwoniella dejecticola CBS 10117]OBR86368.1 hypothetical protein I303_04092 [Kwoniella dejecticola CBS 10117]